MYQQILDHFSGAICQTAIKRVSDSVFIPFDSSNTDYQEYLEWLAEGNEPLPADDPS